MILDMIMGNSSLREEYIVALATDEVSLFNLGCFASDYTIHHRDWMPL